MITLCALLSLVPGAAATFAQGDRNTGEDDQYPPYMFVNTNTSIDRLSSSNIVDVTKYPFFATPNDGTDDTRAILDAINWTCRRMDEFGWRRGMFNRTGAAKGYIIYIPDGTYNISDKLTWTHEATYYLNGQETQTVQRVATWRSLIALFRIFGQSKEGTILKLADNAPGYGAGSKKPVIDLEPHDNGFNNNSFQPGVRNLTIDLGSGNPGAVGLEYQHPNAGTVSRNLKIISSDGTGYAGIRAARGSVHGHLHDITIDGCDYGIIFEEYAPDRVLSLSHVTLTNQNVAGIRIFSDAVVTLRKLRSNNSVPALTIDDATAALLDCELNGTGAGAAIEITNSDATLFARNIDISDYNIGVDVPSGPDVPAAHIDEYNYSDAPSLTLWDSQEKRSLDLPIKDAPVIESFTDFSEWARPAEYGSKDANGQYPASVVNAALSSGKPMVVFPYAPLEDVNEYYEDEAANTGDKLGWDVTLNCPRKGYKGGDYNIPATVKRIRCFGRNVGRFVITEPGDTPLVIENITAGDVVFRAPRTVVVEGARHSRLKYEIPEGVYDKPAVLHTNSGTTFQPSGNSSSHPLEVYARFLNNEGSECSSLVDENMRVVCLSYKTEFAGSNNFEVIEGGILELFGAYSLTRNGINDGGISLFINNDNSHVTMAASRPRSSGDKRTHHIREVRGDEERFYTAPDKRSVGLYAGYRQLSLTSPGEGSAYYTTDSVLLKATYVNFRSNIDSVAFYANDSFIDSDATGSFEYLWKNPPADTYDLYAKTFDDSGESSISNTVNIRVYEPGSGTELVFEGGDDTFIQKESKGTNFGTSATLEVYNRSNKDANALLRFDLSALAEYASVSAARLELTTSTQDKAGGIEVYKIASIDQAWVEGEATWKQESNTNSWNSGNDMTPVAYLSPALATGAMAPDDSVTSLEFSVVSFLKDWADNPSANAGFLVVSSMLDDFGPNNAIYSSEAGNSIHRPRLIVEAHSDITGIKTPRPANRITASPVPGGLLIRGAGIGPATVQLLDCRGRTIARTFPHTQNQVVVPLNDYARGMYIAEVTVGTTSIVRRFIIP